MAVAGPKPTHTDRLAENDGSVTTMTTTSNTNRTTDAMGRVRAIERESMLALSPRIHARTYAQEIASLRLEDEWGRDNGDLVT